LAGRVDASDRPAGERKERKEKKEERKRKE
jgi:hypothetical protein